MQNAVPLLRKKAESEPKPVRLEFRIHPEPTVDVIDGEEIQNPPHWVVLESESGKRIGWGPLETAKSFMRLFALAEICTRLLPEDVITQNLAAMQIGSPRVVEAKPN